LQGFDRYAHTGRIAMQIVHKHFVVQRQGNGI
jgi:hypothetical protein